MKQLLLLLLFPLIIGCDVSLAKPKKQQWELYQPRHQYVLDSIRFANICIDNMPNKIKDLPEIQRIYEKNLDNYLHELGKFKLLLDLKYEP